MMRKIFFYLNLKKFIILFFCISTVALGGRIATMDFSLITEFLTSIYKSVYNMLLAHFPATSLRKDLVREFKDIGKLYHDVIIVIPYVLRRS